MFGRHASTPPPMSNIHRPRFQDLKKDIKPRSEAKTLSFYVQDVRHVFDKGQNHVLLFV